MIYLLPGDTDLPNFQKFGVFTTARRCWGMPRGIPQGAKFAVDNGCFTRPFSPSLMEKTLRRLEPYKSQCLFVTIPDIEWQQGQRFFSAAGSLRLYKQWHKHPMFDGWPLAFVCQNGQENLNFPAGIAAVFIGGTIEWKLSAAADECIKRAKQTDLWTHVGRVNTKRRIKWFDLIGVDSVDGTSITYAPDREKGNLERWLSQPTLWTSAYED